MIGGFVLFATATALGPETSTNTTVAIKDCMEKPVVMNNFTVFVHYKEKSGAPIPGATGSVFITQQKVNPDTCTFMAFAYVDDLYTDGNGQFVTQGIPFVHNNSEDLWRVEVLIDMSENFNGGRKVEVVKYPGNSVIISMVGLRLNDL
jgi:hypothetical protein